MVTRGEPATRKRCVVALQVRDYPGGNHDLTAAITIQHYLDKSARRRHGAFEVA
jgi:hypothetical protein